MSLEELSLILPEMTNAGKSNKVVEVLSALKEHIERNNEDAEIIFKEIYKGISNLEKSDFFGTEGLLRD